MAGADADRVVAGKRFPGEDDPGGAPISLRILDKQIVLGGDDVEAQARIVRWVGWIGVGDSERDQLQGDTSIVDEIHGFVSREAHPGRRRYG